jgi:predicted nucleic acid-binding protein
LGEEDSEPERASRRSVEEEENIVIILLDTTVLIDVLRARQNRRSQLIELIDSGHTLATTAINIGEVYSGMHPNEESATRAFLADLECYSITEPIARRAGMLKSGWARRGRTLTLSDMLIAATALEHHLTLMTDNRKDFPIPELDFHS